MLRNLNEILVKMSRNFKNTAKVIRFVMALGHPYLKSMSIGLSQDKKKAGVCVQKDQL